MVDCGWIRTRRWSSSSRDSYHLYARVYLTNPRRPQFAGNGVGRLGADDDNQSVHVPGREIDQMFVPPMRREELADGDPERMPRHGRIVAQPQECVTTPPDGTLSEIGNTAYNGAVAHRPTPVTRKCPARGRRCKVASFSEASEPYPLTRRPGRYLSARRTSTGTRQSVTGTPRIVCAGSSQSRSARVRADVRVTARLPPREPGVSMRLPATHVKDGVWNEQRHEERDCRPRRVSRCPLLSSSRCRHVGCKLRSCPAR